MKSFYLNMIFFLCSMVLCSCSREKSYAPGAYLKENQQREILRKILPYFARLPKGFTEEKRFDPGLDSFYASEIRKYELKHYYVSPADSFHYFLVTRPAPSLFEKRVAIAGRFRLNPGQEITGYEESFWTFKMKVPELSEKSRVLFHELVNGGDLSAYMPGRKEDEWIEFPDNRVSYSKTDKKWVIRDIRH